jgi:Kdo2-lipid IVA lauroyltransferase/acyltransferase
MNKLLYFLVRYVFKYRLEVVQKNLSHVKLNMDINQYYNHFTNNLIKSLKSLVLPQTKIQSKVVYKNLHVVQSSMDKGRRVMILATHYSNWEWVGLNLPQVLYGDCIAVYKPLSNKFLNNLIKKRRARTGMKLAAMSEVLRFVKQYAENSCFLFIADQSPTIFQPAVSINFLGLPTSFLDGPQKLATRYPFDVYYQSVRESDGNFEVEFINIETKNTLTAEYAALLEKDIRHDPYLWLWTHKRWKREQIYS